MMFSHRSTYQNGNSSFKILNQTLENVSYHQIKHKFTAKTILSSKAGQNEFYPGLPVDHAVGIIRRMLRQPPCPCHSLPVPRGP